MNTNTWPLPLPCDLLPKIAASSAGCGRPVWNPSSSQVLKVGPPVAPTAGTYGPSRLWRDWRWWLPGSTESHLSRGVEPELPQHMWTVLGGDQEGGAGSAAHACSHIKRSDIMIQLVNATAFLYDKCEHCNNLKDLTGDLQSIYLSGNLSICLSARIVDGIKRYCSNSASLFQGCYLFFLFVLFCCCWKLFC